MKQNRHLCLASGGRSLCWRGLVAVLVASSLASVGQAANGRAYEAKGFIRTCKGKMVDQNGGLFVFSGWNG